MNDRKRRALMKRQLAAGGVAVFLVAPVFAGEISTDLTLAKIQANRRAIVEATVAPAPQQAEDFWQTYWEYRGQVGVLNDRAVEVVAVFKAVEGSIPGDRAAGIVNEVLDIEKRRAALKEEYVRNFNDILLPKQVTRWYQTERKMDSIIRAQISLTIPFDSAQVREDAKPSRTEIRNLREELIKELVQPTPKQEKRFWYKYRVYSKSMDNLDDRVAELIDEYTESYESLVNEQARRMTKAAADIDADRLNRLDRLIRELQSVLTAKQTVRLLQAELKLKAMIDFELAAVIPIDE